jgi:hypothetical protein
MRREHEAGDDGKNLDHRIGDQGNIPWKPFLAVLKTREREDQDCGGKRDKSGQEVHAHLSDSEEPNDKKRQGET